MRPDPHGFNSQAIGGGNLALCMGGGPRTNFPTRGGGAMRPRPAPPDPGSVDIHAAIRRMESAMGVAAERTESAAAPAAVAIKAAPAEAAGTQAPSAQTLAATASASGTGGHRQSGCGGSGAGSASAAMGMEGSTVRVAQLPEGLNDVIQLSGHFKHFGQIVNVQLCPEQHVAFIQFRSRAEAVAALDSNEHVLGNERIQVGWARHHLGGGGGGRVGGRQSGRGRDNAHASNAGPHASSGAGVRAEVTGSDRMAMKRRNPSALPATRSVVPPRAQAAVVGAAPAASAAPASVAAGASTAAGGGAAAKAKAASLLRQKDETLQARILEQKQLLAKLGTTKKGSKERAALMGQIEKIQATVQSALKDQKAATAAAAVAATSTTATTSDSAATTSNTPTATFNTAAARALC